MLALLTAGCDLVAPSPTPTLPPRAEEGKVVFASFCSRCHSTLEDTVIVGPSLAGIASRAGTRIEGMDAETYIRASILMPDSYTVEGYKKGLMPVEIADSLSADEFEAVVDYLMTLR